MIKTNGQKFLTTNDAQRGKLRSHRDIAVLEHLDLLLVSLERRVALLRELLGSLCVLLEQVVCLRKADQTLNQRTVVRDESVDTGGESFD